MKTLSDKYSNVLNTNAQIIWLPKGTNSTLTFRTKALSNFRRKSPRSKQPVSILYSWWNIGCASQLYSIETGNVSSIFCMKSHFDISRYFLLYRKKKTLFFTFRVTWSKEFLLFHFSGNASLVTFHPPPPPTHILVTNNKSIPGTAVLSDLKMKIECATAVLFFYKKL